MPDASLKLYITATAEERARRRWRDRNEQGHSNSFAAILADVERRDAFDSSRKHSPLRPADDAIIIDTSDMTPDEIIVEILGLVDGRLPRPA
jgi:cytidylate kinase